jgi:hypothetical protein
MLIVGSILSEVNFIGTFSIKPLFYPRSGWSPSRPSIFAVLKLIGTRSGRDGRVRAVGRDARRARHGHARARSTGGDAAFASKVIFISDALFACHAPRIAWVLTSGVI